jgi:hypothetical protein
MIAQKYVQYTKDWTNVFLGWRNPILGEALDWIREQPGGMYHVHASGSAIKFERKEDAEWFVLKWC